MFRTFSAEGIQNVRLPHDSVSSRYRKATHILHAEDDDNDAFFLLRGKKAEAAGRFNPGEERKAAVEHMECARNSGQIPALLLLDIKMPLMDGFEVLAWIYKDLHLKVVPVVMLSGSVLESDMAKAKMLGAVDYLVKSVEPEGLAAIVQRICSHLRILTPGTEAGGTR